MSSIVNFDPKAWMAKAQEAHDTVSGVSNVKVAAVIAAAVQAYGDALVRSQCRQTFSVLTITRQAERVDVSEFRKAQDCVTAYYEHAKHLNEFVETFKLDKTKLHNVSKVNNFVETLRAAQEADAKRRNKSKRKVRISYSTYYFLSAS